MTNLREVALHVRALASINLAVYSCRVIYVGSTIPLRRALERGYARSTIRAPDFLQRFTRSQENLEPSTVSSSAATRQCIKKNFVVTPQFHDIQTTNAFDYLCREKLLTIKYMNSDSKRALRQGLILQLFPLAMYRETDILILKYES